MALAAATPAVARDGDRDTGPAAAVLDADGLALLLDDARITYRTAPAAPSIVTVRYDMRDRSVGELGRPGPVDLAGFDDLDVALIASVARSPTPAAGAGADARPGFSLYAAWERAPQSRRTGDNDGGRAVVGQAVNGWRVRRERLLDAGLVLRLDGRSDSPALSVGGGVAGPIWRAIPKGE
ncbi:hypothetical protein [Sphingomonas sp.]|uniref:hypothetical protein n=1 Tax=Sphingomonas sp. TaxID=28214 RepID=UPI001B078B49|nr:hypothetical protein [Sphingomonas sp.]MBO9711915.1 hypothetical protein [Sphingomonas sp.]